MASADPPEMKRAFDADLVTQDLARKLSKTRSGETSNSLVDELREEYKKQAQEEHGTIINPITGEEVDIMQQCVNLHVDVGNEREVGDTDAYKEVVRDFSQQLRQGMKVWVLLANGKYQRGVVNRVNSEDETAITYDIQYTKAVKEKGQKNEKVLVLKDLIRSKIKTQQLLVRGDPAGGKTTFAKQLLTWIMRNEEQRWLVPVMIRTVDLVRSKSLFVDESVDMVDKYLEQQYEESGWYKLFKLARQEGRLLLILDGFDEAGALAGRLVKEIHEKLCNEVFIVLTSRDMARTFDAPEFERFRSVRVLELNESQQRQVILRRLGTDDKVDAFCKQLTLNPALGQMAKNPLLLNVTLSVFSASDLEGGAALNRGKVYSIALDGMLGNLEKAKASGSTLQVSPASLRQFLQQVAFMAHTSDEGSGIRDFNSDLIEAAIRLSGVGPEFTLDVWNDIVELIKKGRLPVLAWFVENGRDTFRFAHLTFQEFLCAEQCLKLSLKDEIFIQDWRQLVCSASPVRIIQRGWWQQTLQMYCDLVDSQEAKTPNGLCLSTLLGECFLRLDEQPSIEFTHDVNDNNILTLVSMLRRNATLQHLTLGRDLTSQGLSTFQSLKLVALRSLTLSFNMIDPDGCQSIACFLDNSGTPLETLSLNNNIICQGAAKENMPPTSRRNPSTGFYDSYLEDTSGLEALLAVIQKTRSLTSVDVRGNFMSLEAGRLMFESVKKADHLQSFCGVPVGDMRERNLTELVFAEDAEFFGRSGRRGRDGKFFSTGGAKFLIDMLLLYPQPALHTLRLAHQGLASDRAGVEQMFSDLGRAVVAAEALETLDLSGFWDCGAAAGSALGRAIKMHPRLNQLDVGMGTLRLDDIRARGAEQDAELDLRNVEIRDCGAGVLSEYLPANITKLDIRCCGVGSRGYKTLSQCAHLQQINGIQLGMFTDSCESLDFSADPPRSTGAVACMIARTVLTPNLTHLSLGGANLTSKSHVHALTPVCGGGFGIGCNGGCDNRNFKGTNAYFNCAPCDLDFCSTCCMSECPMIGLAEALQRLPHLVSLIITNCAFEGGRDGGPVRSHLDEEGYKVLGDALRAHTTLTHLDVSRNYFKGPGFPHLAKRIVMMPALTSLKLNENNIEFQRWLSDEYIKAPGGDQDGEASWNYAETLVLCRAIARNSNLKQLDLSPTQPQRFVNEHVVQALVDSFTGASDAADTSSDVQMSDVPSRVNVGMLSIEGFEIPFGALQANSEAGKLERLDFSRADVVKCEKLGPLVELMLRCAKTVKEIDFRNLDFGAATKSIANAVLSLVNTGQLQMYNGIELHGSPADGAFSIERQHVMPHGVYIMASTLLLTYNIKSLNLSSCFGPSGPGMNEWSLGALLGSIVERPSVTSLDISHNHFGKMGVQELADFLCADRTLRALYARSIGFPPGLTAEVQSFSKAIETNITLETLDISGNSVHNRIVEQLKRTLEEKRKSVPFQLDSKFCFLLCNRHLPYHLQLPEVTQLAEIGNLYQEGAQNPMFLIFQYCAGARKLILEGGDADTTDELTSIRERIRRHLIDRYDVEEDDENLAAYLSAHTSNVALARRALRMHRLQSGDDEPEPSDSEASSAPFDDSD